MMNTVAETDPEFAYFGIWWHGGVTVSTLDFMIKSS